MLRCFVSYAREDERIKGELMRALAPLEMEGRFKFWHDSAIPAGDDWLADIRRELDAAHLALFLVSPALLASAFVRREELPRARARQRAGHLVIVPIIISDCLWQARICDNSYGFGDYNALPPYGQPPLDKSPRPRRNTHMRTIGIELAKCAEQIDASTGPSHA